VTDRAEDLYRIHASAVGSAEGWRVERTRIDAIEYSDHTCQMAFYAEYGVGMSFVYADDPKVTMLARADEDAAPSVETVLARIMRAQHFMDAPTEIVE
jgi:hypothetical protein